MRLDLLSQSERNAIRNEYSKDVLYKTMNALCRNLQPKMAPIDILFEDIFVMTCSILDDIKDDPDDFYDYHLSSVWEEIAGEMRLLPKATNNTIAIDNAISTMLYLVCLFLTQWSHPDKGKFQTSILWCLGEHRAISDQVRTEIDTQRNLLQAKIKSVSLPNYLDSEEYVSLDVADLLIKVEDKNSNQDELEESNRLTNSQIILLFIEFLELNLSECNINGIAKLIASVSGRSQDSLYHKIKEYQKKWDDRSDELPFKQDATILRHLLSNIHAKFNKSFDIYIEE